MTWAEDEGHDEGYYEEKEVTYHRLKCVIKINRPKAVLCVFGVTREVWLPVSQMQKIEWHTDSKNAHIHLADWLVEKHQLHKYKEVSPNAC